MKPFDDKNLDDKLRLFATLAPPYKRSGTDVWAAIEERIDSAQAPAGLVRRVAFRWAVAASVAVLLGVLAMMGFSTERISTLKGEHATVRLPDGSEVTLNASSQLSYHPHWWRFSRRVGLSGEAFFKVTKGRTFTVGSGFVETTVLGTSFNVYARRGLVSVTCVTGSVGVSSGNAAEVLKPGEKVDWTEGAAAQRSIVASVQHVDGWARSEFYYHGERLEKVFEDISLQYGIEIAYEKGTYLDTFTYSGHFNKDASPENVLNLVGKPFGLITVKLGDGVFELRHGH